MGLDTCAVLEQAWGVEGTPSDSYLPLSWLQMWHLDARYEGCCKKMSFHVLYDQLVAIITSHLNEMSSAILLPLRLWPPLHVNLYLFIEALPEHIHDCPKSHDTWIRCFIRFQSWWRHM
jgi:hypothetical protein